MCHLDDESALKTVSLLRERHGAERVVSVSSDELIFAPYWFHEVRSDKTTTKITLATGQKLNSSEIGVVFNRLCRLSITHFSNQADRNYATMEIYALFLSWLYSLPCPVINTAVPRGLGSHRYSHLTWLKRAAVAGLPVRDLHFTTSPRLFPAKDLKAFRPAEIEEGVPLHEISPNSLSVNQPAYFIEAGDVEKQSVLITGQRLTGELSSKFKKQLLRLADISGCPLLRVEFGKFNRFWKVTNVDAFPHLTSDSEFSALLTLLEEKRNLKKNDFANRYSFRTPDEAGY